MISLLKEILTVGLLAHEGDWLSTVLHMGSSGECYNGMTKIKAEQKGLRFPW